MFCFETNLAEGRIFEDKEAVKECLEENYVDPFDPIFKEVINPALEDEICRPTTQKYESPEEFFNKSTVFKHQYRKITIVISS